MDLTDEMMGIVAALDAHVGETSARILACMMHALSHYARGPSYAETRALGLILIGRLFERRTIVGEAGPYLERFTLKEFATGAHTYLHFFHRGDHDKDLHDHPWHGRSTILVGGYREERWAPAPALVEAPIETDTLRVASMRAGAIITREFKPGESSELGPDTFHRVDLLDPEGGCWTLFETSPKLKSWGFKSRETGAFTPWRDALARRGLEIPESEDA